MKSATDPDKKEVMRILREHGAVLERTKTHKVWRFPDGRIHVLPGSPSCSHSWKNQLHDLRNFLELNEGRGQPGERRPRKPRKKRIRPEITTGIARDVELRDLASQLVTVREQFGGGTAEAVSKLPSPPIGVGLPIMTAPVRTIPAYLKRIVSRIGNWLKAKLHFSEAK